jgi:hypothetical protein
LSSIVRTDCRFVIPDAAQPRAGIHLPHADIPWIPARLLAQASGMTGSAMVDATLRGNGKFHRTNQYLI